MDINWSKAPEGATHINHFAGRWIKHLGNGQYQFWNGGEWEMGFGCMDSRYTKRPEPDTWNGEGVPPVGTVCEHEPDGFSDKWVTVEVLAHREFKGHDTGLLVVFATEDDVSFSSPECFRPIKTKEQIAAEERESAIEDMVALVVKGQDYSVQAETGTSTADYVRDACKQLHDAGYRRITDAKD